MAASAFLERLRAVVAARQDATAILTGGRDALTFGDLLERAERLAAQLRARGAEGERVVALALEKSADHVVALVGVWLAGAAFLPLDPAAPRERLAFVVRDADAVLVIVHGPTRERFERAGLDVPLFDMGAPAPLPLPVEPRERMPAAASSPDDLAYVIYTSGSTGAPKGVMIPHRGIVSLLDAQIEAFGLAPGKRAISYLSTSFDASLSDIGTALLSGATLLIEPTLAAATPGAVNDLLASRAITHADLPPSLVALLDPARVPSTLEALVVGGEPCPPAVVRRWAQRVRVVNVYGPTEATVCSSLTACDAATWDRPLLGDPLPGVTYRVLDEALRPVSEGAPGELVIGGIGLARGYVRRPELDAARFVLVEGRRVYRTGDRVVVHEDGGLEFLGRLDRQVKVRGLLVAPEEVESQLRAHRDVEQAAVVARLLFPRADGGGRPVLVAFVVPREGADVARDLPRALVAHLSRALPRWMLPQRYELVASLPTTSSGKVDLAALTARPLTRPRRAPEATPAPDPLRARIVAAAFAAVLRLDDVAATDDFFDLGGDSLAVLELVAEAGARGLSLSPAVVLAARTVGAIAARGPASDARTAQELLADVTFDGEMRASLARSRGRASERGAREEPRAIFVTGATGFFGARLLAELLRRTRAQVVCLARAPNDTAARRRCLTALASHGIAPSASESARIVAVAGDIAASRLGLGDTAWRHLASTIDSVYHCAAEVDAVRPYEELRAANVGGTLEVVRLACEGRRKRVHHVSTLSVLLARDDLRAGPTPRLSERDVLPATTAIVGGYAQTKWAAEAAVRAAVADAGPIAIYRLGLVTGDSTTGYAPWGDSLGSFFRSAASHGRVPHARDALEVDVTPVDFAAAATAHLSLHAAADDGLSTFHVANPRRATLADLASALPGIGVELDESADVDVTVRPRPGDLFQATGAVFEMDATDAGLVGSGITCPAPTTALLGRYARYALGLAHDPAARRGRVA